VHHVGHRLVAQQSVLVHRVVVNGRGVQRHGRYLAVAEQERWELGWFGWNPHPYYWF
jgi:hypothetical protein